MKGKLACADKNAGEAFPPEFLKLVVDGGFSSQQAFSLDKTRLFWKKIASHMCIAKEEKSASGFKASKDRLILLLESNPAGNVKLKPILVYHSENPCALKG